MSLRIELIPSKTYFKSDQGRIDISTDLNQNDTSKPLKDEIHKNQYHKVINLTHYKAESVHKFIIVDMPILTT